MSREMIDAILGGDNNSAQEIFKKDIAAKVGDALELKRRDYAKSFVGAVPNEETDEV